MTVGLNGTNLAELPAAAQRERARQMWHADPSLTGADLGPMFGKSARWGQQQRAAAEAAAGNGTDAAQRNAATERSDGTATVPSGTPARAAATHTGTARTERPQAPSKPRAATQPSETVPPLLLGLTVLSVGMVTVVCAVVNYFHVRDLATLAGMGGLAGWLPLGVDGLVVASTCSVIADRHLKQPVEALAVIGVILGLAGSLAANVLAVDPEIVSLRAVRWVLAGYSPAALAVSVHLLIRMLGAKGQP